jgi:hypothetical protein
VLSPPFAGGVPLPDAPDDVTLVACGLQQREKLIVAKAAAVRAL